MKTIRTPGTDAIAEPIADQLIGRSAGQRTEARSWLWRPLLALLARGLPVPTDQIARATGRSAAEIRDALAALPDTEFNEDGCVVGSGLTFRPTPHRFEVDGKQLYTWCALDTLIFPTVLGRPAQIRSTCHHSGQTITLTVEPDGVSQVQPVATVVSIVAPDASANIRSSFCNEVHFFASSELATTWLEQHPGADVVPVTDAYDLGRPIASAILADGEPPRCC